MRNSILAGAVTLMMLAAGWIGGAPQARAQAEAEANGEWPVMYPSAEDQTFMVTGAVDGDEVQFQRALQRLSRRLALTPEQEAAAWPILQDQEYELNLVRSDACLTNEERREQTRLIRDQARLRIGALLNDEQRRRFN